MVGRLRFEGRRLARPKKFHKLGYATNSCENADYAALSGTEAEQHNGK
jgi:hypothetical protein